MKGSAGDIIDTGGWISRNTGWMKALIRVVFGFAWLIDGSFKFTFLSSQSFLSAVRSGAGSQPHWMMPWFNFWLGVVGQHTIVWLYAIGIGELMLGIALVFGIARKLAYSAGFVLSLFIWAVPEGLGGPYGPGSTDIGTGVIYAFVFLLFMIINSEFGTSRYSVDRILEDRIRWWKKIAEFGYKES